MAVAVPKAESAGNKVVQKLKREGYVQVLGQTYAAVEFNANVLPSLDIDPRDNKGKEVVRIHNNTSFSGLYQVTDCTTTYSSGKRVRSLQGVAIKLDGLSSISGTTLDNSFAQATVAGNIDSVVDTPTPSGDKAKDLVSKGQKTITDAENMISVIKDGVTQWYNSKK
jgi:hypothetical protein